jgi:branched-chain amino acid aminotransferase
MRDHIAYFNGEWGPNSEVRIDPFDRGFTMGDAVFDVERTFDGHIFRLREHLDRLYRSLQYLRLDCGVTIDEMTSITEELVHRNEPMREPGGDYMVRQVVTRGTPKSGTQGGVWEPMTPTVINMVSPIDLGGYARAYDRGASVVFPSVRGYSSSSLDPKVKHYSRGNFVLAQLQAADVEPEAHPVLLDQDGNIAENIGANFFIVTDGVIRTPGDSSILQGISRMVVFELANQLGIPIVEEPLQPYDAYTADETFLANTIYQLLPVGTVDNRRIGEKTPGPISTQLLAAWSEMVGVDIVGQALRQAGR